MILTNYWKLLMNTQYNCETTSDRYNLVDLYGNVFSNYAIVHPTDPTDGRPVTYWNGIQPRTFDGFLIGKGTGTIQTSDHCLFSDITSRHENLRLVVNNSSESGRFNTTIVMSGNLGAPYAPYDITEFGLYKDILCTDYSIRRVLVAKVLLDEPIHMEWNSPFRIACDWIQS